MVTILSNAVILKGEELEPVEGQIRIRNGRIDKITSGSVRRGLDLKRSIIIPPLFNAHTHIVDSIAKERYLGKKLDEVVGINGEKFKALASFPESLKKTAAEKTMKDMVRSGTLAHCDFREEAVRGVKLLKRTSVEIPKSIVLGRPSEKNELDAVIEIADGIGLPSIDEYSEVELKRIAEKTRSRKKILAAHIAEDRRYENSEIKKVLNLRPSFLVHGTHLSKPQLSMLSKTNVPLVFCPRANHILGAGKPPLKEALEVNLKFFLGTDNAMVCQPDILAELSFAWAHLRMADQSCGAEEAMALLRSATVDAAKFFRMPWGPVEEGENATFIVLARKNNLQHLCNIHAGLVNRARADNVREIYFEGKRIVPQ